MEPRLVHKRNNKYYVYSDKGFIIIITTSRGVVEGIVKNKPVEWINY